MAGLSVGRLIRVVINLAVLAAQRRGFGTLLLLGDSDVIDPTERIRTYTGIEGVAADFGLSSPEYLAASLYYQQSPKPLLLSIGRWVRTASKARLRGGILSSAEQLMSNFTAITNGSTQITVDGVVKTLSALNFSSDTNLNQVATRITTALAGAVVTWDGQRFITTSPTTGVSSTLTYYSATGSGTDISGLIKGTLATALAPVNGVAAETPVAAAAVLADKTTSWYGLQFAASVQPTVDQSLAVSAFIEAAEVSRLFGYTDTDSRALDAVFTTDFGSQAKALNRKRTVVQYSSNPYAIASFFGRAFSTNFNANRSTITLMYKQEPGIVAETITETQAQTLKNKRINVFVNYNNETAIIQYGVMSGPAYFDEMHGLDWFQNAVQNEEYNRLYQAKTKVPQTDAGMNELVNVAAAVCEEAINNGLAAPGQWNGDAFGQLETGDFLTEGYYIYAPPMASQPQSIRETRVAPPMQIALKLAGAIHELDVIVDVNR
jgi:hypothetical protein